MCKNGNKNIKTSRKSKLRISFCNTLDYTDLGFSSKVFLEREIDRKLDFVIEHKD